MEWSKTLWKAIDHYRYTVAALVVTVVAVVVMIAAAGCESRTLTPGGEKITRSEMANASRQIAQTLEVRRSEVEQATAAYNAEAEAYNDWIADAEADLDRQDEVRANLLAAVSVSAGELAAGTVNPAGLITLGIGLAGAALGLGASADNRRKDKVITTIKTGPAGTT